MSWAGPEGGGLWVLQVLFWACPDSTEAPDGFWSGQMLQPVAGCGCCGACWFRRCSAGPSGRSSGEQRASSGASSSFLALQGRAWGLARKDYGTGGRKIQAWAASESLLGGARRQPSGAIGSAALSREDVREGEGLASERDSEPGENRWLGEE